MKSKTFLILIFIVIVILSALLITYINSNTTYRNSIVDAAIQDIQVKFLGTGAGTYADRQYSSVLLDDELIIDFSCQPNNTTVNKRDCGVMRLDSYNVDKNKINYIVMTHAHDDHTDPNEVVKLAEQRTSSTKLTIYGGQSVIDTFNTYLSQNNKVGIINLVHLDKYTETQIGNYYFTALPANHDAGIEPYVYMIRKGSKRMLYATDTGILKDEVTNYLVNNKFSFDLVIYEGTFHKCGSVKVSGADTTHGHMNFCRENTIRINWISKGIIKETTPWYLTHIASWNYPGTCGEPDDTMICALDTVGGFPISAYDGLVVSMLEPASNIPTSTPTSSPTTTRTPTTTASPQTTPTSQGKFPVVINYNQGTKVAIKEYNCDTRKIVVTVCDSSNYNGKVLTRAWLVDQNNNRNFLYAAIGQDEIDSSYEKSFCGGVTGRSYEYIVPTDMVLGKLQIVAWDITSDGNTDWNKYEFPNNMPTCESKTNITSTATTNSKTNTTTETAATSKITTPKPTTTAPSVINNTTQPASQNPMKNLAEFPVDITFGNNAKARITSFNCSTKEITGIVCDMDNYTRKVLTRMWLVNDSGRRDYFAARWVDGSGNSSQEKSFCGDTTEHSFSVTIPENISFSTQTDKLQLVTWDILSNGMTDFNAALFPNKTISCK